MNKNIKQKFIKSNKLFWNKFKEADSNDLLLVETSTHPVINHANAVVAKIIAQAKNLRIGWLKYPVIDEKLMYSYSQNSLLICLPKTNFLRKFWLIFLASLFYLYYVLLKNNLLSFKYKNIFYGDFVYDGYLKMLSMATLHKLDLRIINVIYKVLLNDKNARFLFDKYPIKAVLVSHYMTVGTGPLSRVALQRKIPVYWKGGGVDVINLAVFRKLNQIYDYPKKPPNIKIELLNNKYKKQIEADFIQLINNIDKTHYNPLKIAYKNTILSKIDRTLFLKILKLEKKPICFVMLHAFNDYPHSHYKKMLFKDYYDWFIQTLNYAKSDLSKNWIFKEHPANKFYPTKDLNFNKIMKNLPSHIKFVSRKSQIGAAVVLNVADLIITCLGSAGVEMPALKGIPSIVAGDSSYDGFGFTIEPKTQREFFKILRSLVVGRLSSQKQLTAKYCYTYLNKYCMMSFAAGPSITIEENMRTEKLKNQYLRRVLKRYQEKRYLIYNQINKYIKAVKKTDFYRLESPAFIKLKQAKGRKNDYL